jgi:hypothetical protein
MIHCSHQDKNPSCQELSLRLTLPLRFDLQESPVSPPEGTDGKSPGSNPALLSSIWAYVLTAP